MSDKAQALTPIAEARKPPSKLPKDEAFSVLKSWFLLDSDHSKAWRGQARNDFGFYAGDQWEPADRAKLDSQKRPVITFNQVLAVVKAVCGMEINSRRKIAYLPRGGTAGQDGIIKVAVNEILTGASQWMSSEADAEDEESEAFQDTNICGMGWTEPGITYEEDPEGMYREPKVDPLEMYWDKSARSKNLVDAKRLARARKVALDDAMARFQGYDAQHLDASWADLDEITTGKPIEERQKKLGEGSYAEGESEVTLIHMQWVELQPYYRVIDPGTGNPADVSEEKWPEIQKAATEAGQELTFARLHKRVFKQAYLGGEGLISEITDCPAKDRFTWQCITGERNAIKGTWFGLITLMRDPQMWANKLFAQTLHIMNSTAKGGVIAEKSAFDDLAEAQETYAFPDAITIVEDGAISGNKIMAKPGTGNPAMYVQLLQFCLAAIRSTTGLNIEAMGLAERNQPIGLEETRKQAAMTILATLFDSFRRFQRNIGRVRLTYIQNYLSNGQLIRLAGADGYKLVPLTRDKTVGRYEVIVDDTPTSPNEQKETWEAIKGIFPVIAPTLTPEAVSLMMDYMPIPVQLKQSFKALLAKPNPQAEQAAMVALQTALATIENIQSTTRLNTAKVGTEQTKALENLSTIDQDQADASYARAKADLLNAIHPTIRHQLPTMPSAQPPREPAQLQSLPTQRSGPAGGLLSGMLGSGGPTPDGGSTPPVETAIG